MPREPEHRVWFVECAGQWRPARPLHAFDLIFGEDKRQQRTGVIGRRVRVFANYDALYPETHEAFDGAELHWFHPTLTAETAAQLAQMAKLLAMTHETKAMREIYERCRVHLDFEAKRLATRKVETSYIGQSLDD
jgi:hypothetical protein